MTNVLHKLSASKALGWIATLVAGLASLCLLDKDAVTTTVGAYGEWICKAAAVVSYLIAWFSKSPASRRTGAVDEGGPVEVTLANGQTIPNRRGVNR